MKKFNLILILIILIFVVLFIIQSKEKLDTVSINEVIFEVDIVDNSLTRQQGLSGRQTLADKTGMLFLFPNKDQLSFWMKGMNFNIDLLWIDDNIIIGYEKNMLAPEFGTISQDLIKYLSPQEVNKVLELPAGNIDKFNIKINDIIIF